MAKRLEEIENPMVLHQAKYRMPVFKPDPVLCGCDAYAKLYIKGVPYCYECAEEMEEVVRI